MDDSVQGPRLRRIVVSNSQHADLPVSLPWKSKTHEVVKSVSKLPPAYTWGRDQQCYFLSTWHSLPPQRGISPPMGSVPFVLFSSVWPLAPFHWLAPCRHPHFSSTPPPPPRHLGIGTLSHFCPSLFQTSTARPKWQEANVEFKSEGCRQTRLATSVLQKWHSNCANLITKVQPCLCQGGEGERDHGCLGLIGLSFSTCWVNHMQFSRPLDSHN